MQTVILLHGAIGAASQLTAVRERLAGDFDVHNISFSGHGGMPEAEQPFSITLFADDVIRYMEQHMIETASFIGYSMGGYVALYLARHYPEKVERVITLATKLVWSEEIASKEAGMLDAGKIEQKLPAFADVLRQRHHPADWKNILRKTAHMLREMGERPPLKPEDYRLIKAPVLLMSGDKDKMVTPSETLSIYPMLEKGACCVLPDTPHPVEQANMEALCFLARQFLQKFT